MMKRRMTICVTLCLLQGAPRHFFYVILERKIPGHRYHNVLHIEMFLLFYICIRTQF